MKLLLVFFLFSFSDCFSQITDLPSQNKVVVFKDQRIDVLARKEAEINTSILKKEARSAQGFRLMILNTSDKEYAFKIRAELLQKFPEQKPYMWYANPYIRIKFGNFKTKEDADVYKKQISKMLGGATIYYLNETIEVAPDKDFDPDNLKSK
ncbi:MAG: SPOR domain-containing protein [Ginsengibacter sp.]